MKYFIIMLIQLCIGATLMAADAKDYEVWVKDLGNDKWRIREEATRDLIKAGEDALSLVVKAKKSDDAEVRQRARYIARLVELNMEREAIRAIGSKKYYTKDEYGWLIISRISHEIDDYGFVSKLYVYENNEKLFLNLKKFKRMKLLWIFNPISEKHAKEIGKLRSLEVLQLWQKKKEKKGKGDVIVKHIASLDLQELDLDYCGITDDGLKYLKGMKKLDTLRLRGNEITDKGLKHLEELKELKSLYLSYNKVTAAGVKLLREKNIGCDIGFWEGDDP